MQSFVSLWHTGPMAQQESYLLTIHHSRSACISTFQDPSHHSRFYGLGAREEPQPAWSSPDDIRKQECLEIVDFHIKSDRRTSSPSSSSSETGRKAC